MFDIREFLFQVLAQDFKRIDLNIKTIPQPLVSMNNKIYDTIRFAREYQSPTDRQFKEADLRRFQVELFFKPFFEKLLTKDFIWDHVISSPTKLQPSEAEEFSILVNEVGNQLSHIFTKVVSRDSAIWQPNI